MIYLIQDDNINKIDLENLRGVISYIFKDHPHISENYYDFIDAARGNIDLLNGIKDEIIYIIERFNKEPEKTQLYENELIAELKKRFNDLNSDINKDVIKKIIDEREEEEKKVFKSEDLFSELIF